MKHTCYSMNVVPEVHLVVKRLGLIDPMEWNSTSRY